MFDSTLTDYGHVRVALSWYDVCSSRRDASLPNYYRGFFHMHNVQPRLGMAGLCLKDGDERLIRDAHFVNGRQNGHFS